jgi:hypothetical protein
MDRATFLAGVAALFAPETGRFSPASSVTVPMLVQNNRIYVDADFSGSADRISTLSTQIDTGGGALIIARRAADDLGLKLRGKPNRDGLVEIAAPGVNIGPDRIATTFAATTLAQANVIEPGASSPAFLPGALLRDHVVTFDYTSGTFALEAAPLRATQIPVRISGKSGFPRVELVIDDEPLGFLLDTGASFTMLSQSVVDQLRRKHSSWPWVRGAYGSANMTGGFGERNATMLRIPQVRFGPMLLESIDVVSRPAGTFERYMSSLMSAPIVGALGGNVLRNFAFRLDYPQQRLEARYTHRPWPDELTIAPIVLQPQRDGSYLIAGTREGEDLSGARLVAVDGHEIDGQSLYAVQQLLRGVRGSMRTIAIIDAEQRSRKVAVAVAGVL